MRKYVYLKIAVFIVFLSCISSFTYSGILHKNLSINLPGIYAGAVACGDLNNDKLIDLMVIGETEINGKFIRISKVYRNTGSGFIEDSNTITGVYFGSIALGDYNNNGFLDLVISGLDSQDVNVLEIYKNISSKGGQIKFELDKQQNTILSPENQLRYSSLDWGDYNKDGLLDLAVCGMNNLGEASTIVFKNRGSLSYVLEKDVSQVLLNINKGQIRWMDYDNDGDLDLSLCGFNTLGRRAAKIFKNEPVGILREDKNNSEIIEKLSSSYMEWGDANNDGNLDLLQSGWAEGWYASVNLFENRIGGNLGDNIISNLTNNNPQLLIVGPVAWGDYDNDGDFDIVMMGVNEFSQNLAFILKNNQGQFEIDNQQNEFTGLKNGFLKWIDYNNDGRLDLIAGGEDEDGNRKTYIYENDESKVATKPSPPNRLKNVFVTNNNVTFSWEEGSDVDFKDSENLTYILRVGQTPGGNDIYSGAIPVGNGNMGNALSFKLNIPLSRTTYYWSVRTVDAQYQVSDEFSPEAIFLIKRFVNSNQTIVDLQQTAIAWGDYNNDGFIDLITAGEDINGKSRTVLFTNNKGVLQENTSIVFPNFKNGSFAWGDYDNDGDLDLALSGNDGSSKISYIFKNDPAGTLKLDIPNSNRIVKVDQSSMDWGDCDNDGDLDLAIIGVDESGNFITKIYLNTNGILNEDITQNLSEYANGKVKWIDYDNDGDLDLAVIGDNLNPNYNGGRIYKNDGSGKFTEDINSRLPAVFSSDMAWCDFDNDGDMDVVVTGQSLITNQIEIKVLINDPVGTLKENLTLSNQLNGVRGGSICWGDYDNDGNADIVISGNDENNQPIIEAYDYRNNTFYPDIYPVFFGNGVQFSSVSLMDIENDGDLDLITIGAGSNLTSFSSVYDNNEGIVNPNENPEPPSNLKSEVKESQVILSWNRATDPEGNGTDSLALTYIYRIGTTYGGNEIATGKFEPGFGKSGLARSLTVRNLKSNIYYWSVKSIDNGFKESIWVPDKTFTIDIIKPDIKIATSEPGKVGIGKATIKIIIDENFSLNLSKRPIVKFKIGSVESRVNQISYDGFTWIGEAVILPAMPSGTAVISVDSVFDSQGNMMDYKPNAGTFTIDTEPPYVVMTTPRPNQTGVSISTTLKAIFNEDIIQSSLVAEKSFRLFYDGIKVEGTINYNPETKEGTFIPTDKLKGASFYEVRITGKVKDLVGNTLGNDTTWIFKTAETVLAGSGGLVSDEIGNVKIYISPNALEADEEVPISSFESKNIKPPQGVKFTGVAYSIGPENTTVSLKKPAVLNISYNKNLLPSGVDENKLKLFILKESNPGDFDYENPIGGTVDIGGSKITTSINKFGVFGIFEDVREKLGVKAISNVNFSPRVFSPAGSGQMNLPSQTGISFTLGEPMNVTITIFSPSGRFVKKLVENQSFGNGDQVVSWDGKDGNGTICTSGIYIVKIEGAGISVFKTVAVLNK